MPLILFVAASAMADVSVAPAPAGRAPRHIVLTAPQAAACSSGLSHAKYVTPSSADVRRLDSLLPAALADIAAASSLAKDLSAGRRQFLADGAREVLKRLGTDIRFYTGAADGHIFVEGYCPWPEVKDGQCPPYVNDGGSCVWEIRFDVKRATFDQFGTNGEG